MADDVAAATRGSLDMADKLKLFARGSLETLVQEVQELNRRHEVHTKFFETVAKYNAGVLELITKRIHTAEKHEEATREFFDTIIRKLGGIYDKLVEAQKEC